MGKKQKNKKTAAANAAKKAKEAQNVNAAAAATATGTATEELPEADETKMLELDESTNLSAAAATATEQLPEADETKMFELDEFINLSEHSSSLSSHADSFDSMPGLMEIVEYQPNTSADANNYVPISKQSRGEKKARRQLMKFDLKPLEDVSRVVLRKLGNVLIYIDRPTVYRCPRTQTYICFGEARIEDANANTADALLKNSSKLFKEKKPQPTFKDLDDTVGNDADDEDDGDTDVDTSNLSERDIELVQVQANCSRKSAIRALVNNEHDLVNAIMELTIA